MCFIIKTKSEKLNIDENGFFLNILYDNYKNKINKIKNVFIPFSNLFIKNKINELINLYNNVGIIKNVKINREEAEINESGAYVYKLTLPNSIINSYPFDYILINTSIQTKETPMKTGDQYSNEDDLKRVKNNYDIKYKLNNNDNNILEKEKKFSFYSKINREYRRAGEATKKVKGSWSLSSVIAGITGIWGLAVFFVAEMFGYDELTQWESHGTSRYNTPVSFTPFLNGTDFIQNIIGKLTLGLKIKEKNSLVCEETYYKYNHGMASGSKAQIYSTEMQNTFLPTDIQTKNGGKQFSFRNFENFLIKLPKNKNNVNISLIVECGNIVNSVIFSVKSVSNYFK